MSERDHDPRITAADEAGFRQLADNLADGILVNAGGRHVYANRRMGEILGRPPDDLLGTTLEDLVHPAEVALIHDRFRRRMLGEPVPDQYETVFVSRHGEPVAVEIAASKTSWRGAPAGLVSVRDIRARLSAQSQLEQINRLLLTVAAIDAMIVRETDRARLLDESCRILVQVGGYRSAWIGITDWQSQEIRPVAYVDALREYVQGLRVRCDDTPEGRGPAGLAVRNNRPQVVNDAESDPAFALWRDRARAAGYRSVLVIPLRTGMDRVTGVVAVHAVPVNAFGGEEVELLARMADNIGHALRMLTEAEERRRADRELAETADELNRILDNLQDVYYRTDLEDVWFACPPPCRTCSVMPRTNCWAGNSRICMLNRTDATGFSPRSRPRAGVSGAMRRRFATRMVRRCGSPPIPATGTTGPARSSAWKAWHAT